jgi:hypothetical protein
MWSTLAKLFFVQGSSYSLGMGLGSMSARLLLQVIIKLFMAWFLIIKSTYQGWYHVLKDLDNQSQISVWLSNDLIIKTKNPIIKSINTPKKAWYHSLLWCCVFIQTYDHTLEHVHTHLATRWGIIRRKHCHPRWRTWSPTDWKLPFSSYQRSHESMDSDFHLIFPLLPVCVLPLLLQTKPTKGQKKISDPGGCQRGIIKMSLRYGVLRGGRWKLKGVWCHLFVFFR